MNKFKLSIKIFDKNERYINERIIDSFDTLKECQEVKELFYKIYKLIKNQK